MKLIAERVHPEVVEQLRVPRGDVAGHALVEPELPEQAERGGQALLAVRRARPRRCRRWGTSAEAGLTSSSDPTGRRRRRPTVPTMPIGPSDVLLDGRVAVVTGAGSGIGRGIAAGFAAFGAAVAIWEQNPDTCAAAAEQIGALGHPDRRPRQRGGRCRPGPHRRGARARVDPREQRGWGVLVADPRDHRERLGRPATGPTSSTCCCARSESRGAWSPRGSAGSIINVTSIEGVRAAPGYAAYAAAKAGVISYTKTAALELAPHGIRVNALAPDITLTEGLQALAPPGFEARIGHTVPMGRAGHVDEMAGAAVFLASDLAELHHRPDDPRRRRHPRRERLVPPPRDGRLPAGTADRDRGPTRLPSGTVPRGG